MKQQQSARSRSKPLRQHEVAPQPQHQAEQPLGALSMQQLQRTVGNQQTQRIVRRMHASTIQRVSVPPTQADQEAEAAQTLTLVQDVHREMLRHSDRTIRNTAKLFAANGAAPQRMAFSPMTLRSDSNALVAAGGLSAATAAFFFFGATQNNQHQSVPNTMGTINTIGGVNTILVRGRDSSGNWQSHNDIIGTFVHEASHILVASYGQHPGTVTDASSFDRYKDEFRAYWVEPYGHAWNNETNGNTKAQAIRKHMVGAAAAPPTGYPDLQNRYWTQAAFKTQVDTHLRPDGYNLSNNPNLDRLFTLIGGGVAQVDATLTHIVSQLNPAERAEANSSGLIDQQIARYHDPDAETRVHNALRFPRTDEAATQLNPNNSPRIAALIEALALRDTEQIKARAAALTPAERGELMMNAAVMLFVDRQIADKRLRACIYALLVTGRSAQFEAMDRFLDACLDAQIILLAGDAPTTTPDFLRERLRAVQYEARLALFRLVEDARREFVDALPAPVNNRVLHALREGNELE